MKYKKNPDPRHVLPTRRLAENIKLKTPEGHTIHLTIGYDPDEIGRPREVFYSAGFRSGSQLEFQIQDACVMLSLLLQHGLKPKDIERSLSRVEQPDGSLVHGSVIGLIAEKLECREPLASPTV